MANGIIYAINMMKPDLYEADLNLAQMDSWMQSVIDTSSPFYQHWLTLIPTWICNHMPSKLWDEITYPFLNFNTIEV